MGFLAEDSLRFNAEGEAVDRGLADAITELIDRISFIVEALHDAERAAIDCRTEETRDRRIAQVLSRNSQRRKLPLAVLEESRIEKLNAQ